MTDLKRVTIFISDEATKALKKMAIDYNLSISKLVEYLVKKEEEIKNK